MQCWYLKQSKLHTIDVPPSTTIFAVNLSRDIKKDGGEVDLDSVKDHRPPVIEMFLVERYN